MGYLSTILAAILCSATPIISVETQELTQKPRTEQTESNFKLGKETISSIRSAYQKGDYNSFLKEMDDSYAQAKAENGLDGLIQMRQKEISAADLTQWEAKFTALQQEKNKDLLGALSDKDDSLFAQKVRSIAANISTPEQEKAISRLHNLLIMAPNSGQNSDENKLIDIDMEYEYKLMHAAMPPSNILPEQIQQHQIALRMEKMDKMVQASKTFQDHDLKQAVGLTAANLDARLARNLDGADINAFVKGNAKPTTELEEKIVSILSGYQAQFSDLMKEVAGR